MCLRGQAAMRLRSWNPDAGPWKAWSIRAQGDYRTAEGLNQVDLVIENPGLNSAVDDGVVEFKLFEMAAGEVHLLAAEVARGDPVAAAVEHIDLRPGAAVEAEAGPGAAGECRAAQSRSIELRLAEVAIDEGASRNRYSAEVALREVAARELACTPARLLEAGGGEAGARESRAGELRQIQVEPRVGEAVGLPHQAGGRTACAFAPHVVSQDDQLRAHVSGVHPETTFSVSISLSSHPASALPFFCDSAAQ